MGKMFVKKSYLLLLILSCQSHFVVSQKGQTSANVNKGVSDGHRLITRALWRIFDALMEKKNHEELYGRISLVEKAVMEYMATNTKSNKEIEALKLSLRRHKEELSTFKKEVERVKNMESRVKDIEEAQLRLERQRDEGLVEASAPVWAAAGYSSCPPPFTTVGDMCIHVVFDRKLGWREARRDCANIGGDLSSPRDLSLLKDYLASMPSDSRPEYVWVGGSRTVDDTWIWATGNQAGRPMDMSKDTWNEELPEGIGDCLGLYERAAYRAYDYTCNELDNFVCQFFL